MTRSAFPFIIVTGLSGAGKSTALKVFEDLGFFCVDGLPAAMVPKLAALYQGQYDATGRGLVLGMDIRQREFISYWNEALGELKRLGAEPELIFIEASLAELMRRYHETRRPHPLESEHLGLSRALEEEERILEPLRSQASLVVDTTDYSIHDLRRTLQEKWTVLSTHKGGLRVHLISFGFKHGPPKEADMVLDLRFLPNPHFVQELRPLTGQNEQVAQYVFDNDLGREFKTRLTGFLTYLVPLYAKEGRYRLTIALGCTGGRHRSVATAEMIHDVLAGLGYMTTIEHRHMNRT